MTKKLKTIFFDAVSELNDRITREGKMRVKKGLLTKKKAEFLARSSKDRVNIFFDRHIKESVK